MKRAFESLLPGLEPLLDHFFLLRPFMFFPVWLATAAGLGAGQWSENPELFWHVAFNGWITLLFMGVSLISGAASIMVQLSLADRQTASVSLSILEKLNITPQKARRFAWVYLALGLLALLMAGIPAVIAGGMVFILWSAGGWPGMFSSFRSPIVTILLYILGAGALFYIGWSASGAPFAGSLSLALSYMAAFGALALLTTLYAGPRQLLREPRPGMAQFLAALIVSTALMTTATIWGYLNGDPVLSTAAILSLPFFAVGLVYRRDADNWRTIRYGILIMAFFLTIRHPLLGIPLAANFYLCRFYYLRRFGILYPVFQILPDQYT